MPCVRCAGSGSKEVHLKPDTVASPAARGPRELEEVAMSENKRSAKEILEYLAERVRRIEGECHNVGEVLERMAERLPTPRVEPVEE
jgi:hypothetical protein